MLVSHFLSLRALAMLAQTLRTWASLAEIGQRFRSAMLASLAITAVALLSSIELVVKFDVGSTRSGGTATGADSMWLPNRDAIRSRAPRCMDWSITVPRSPPS